MYEATRHGLVYNKSTKEGCEVVPLTNFNAKITADICHDDGVDTMQHFEIEATINGKKRTCQVPAGKFAQMNWVLEHFGHDAVIYAGHSMRDHTRTAIQILSEDAITRTTYTHTGWRKIGDTYYYLIGNGAVGRDGIAHTIDVSMPDTLDKYGVSEPKDNKELIDALQASIQFLDAAEKYITIPLFCAIYRAVLGNCDYSVHLCGSTGEAKSTLAALALSHFGKRFNDTSLPASWSSTANAIEMLAFVLKDCVMVVDDFKPAGSRMQQQALYSAAERLLRAQGNKSGRQRLRADSTLRSTKPPRGLIVSTGEDLPLGQSIRARCQIIEIARGDVWRHKEMLTYCQRQAACGLYEKAMFGYIRWVAAHYERIQKEQETTIHEIRTQVANISCHKRTPGIIASQFLGMKYFVEFALSVNAITQDTAERLLGQCWSVLVTTGMRQSEVQEAEDPALRFIELVSSAISSGRAHIAATDGTEPSSPEAFGWRSVKVGLNSEWRPLGDRIGWTDGYYIYLDPDASLKIALIADSQNTLAITPRTLKARLVEKGLVIPDKTRNLTTVRRTLQGRKQVEVLHLRPGLITGGDGEDISDDCPIQ